MKKWIVFLLIITFVLTGCSTKQAQSTPTTNATESVPTTNPQESTPETLPESQPAETVPETTVNVTEEPTAPTESKPQQTTPPSSSGNSKPSGGGNSSSQSPSGSTQETPKPTPQKPPVSSVPGRPVSSATCKDTGSNSPWPNPNANTLDYYEEKDPERISYLQYLLREGNSYSYWIEEEEMRMYLGRTYGIPLYTSYEMLIESTWASSDPSVATVNQVGYVVPKKVGSTVITVTYVDPETHEPCTRQCRITVEKEPAPYTYAQLEQRAKEEAKKIADYAMAYPTATTDLERIAIAAALVNAYVADGVYTSNVAGYNQPFGTLVTFYSSCAGSTRAMGLVLEYMGFEWYHKGESQWTHQWCIVYDVDGQTAFADGSVLGMAGYGTWEGNGSNWRMHKNGNLTSVSPDVIRMVQAQTILP